MLLVIGLGRFGGYEPPEGALGTVFNVLFMVAFGAGQWIAGGVGYIAGAVFGYRKAGAYKAAQQAAGADR